MKKCYTTTLTHGDACAPGVEALGRSQHSLSLRGAGSLRDDARGLVLAIDHEIGRWMARYGLTVLRVGLGLVFAWFGALKLFPGLSPAEELVTRTVPFIAPRVLIPGLGVFEIVIGLGLILGVFMRSTLLLLFAQQAGTLLPLLLLRGATWIRFPFALTLEGQYIVKNVVLIGAALVLGGALHRRRGRERSTPGNRELPQRMSSLQTY